MHGRLLLHARQNVVAYLALFVALGGTSYAAIKLPANSVGPSQLKSGAVTAKKIRARAVDSAKVKDGSLRAGDFAAGQLPAGPAGAPGARGETGPQGSPGAPGAPGASATIDGVAAGGSLTGTYPSPTIAAGAVAPGMFGTIPAARAAKTADQPLPAQAAVTFDSETFDNAAMHDNVTNNSRLTAPIAGTYLVTATINTTINMPSSWNAVLRKQLAGGGTQQFAVASRTESGSGLNSVSIPLTGIVQMAPGDYVDVLVSLGGASPVVKSAFTSLSMAWIGRG